VVSRCPRIPWEPQLSMGAKLQSLRSVQNLILNGRNVFIHEDTHDTPAQLGMIAQTTIANDKIGQSQDL
jgi:hypothetical protein